MPPIPIEQATITEVRAWLSEAEAEQWSEAGNEDLIPRWPVTLATLTAALRIVGVDHPEPLLISVDAGITYLRTHTDVLKHYTLLIDESWSDAWFWVQIRPSRQALTYIWGAECETLPLAVAVLILCIACYPDVPRYCVYDWHNFRTPLTRDPEA